MRNQEPQTHGDTSDLASFGEELRREREIRGISLKEISDATKISRRFLDAIERNDHRTLPAPVFTRGFVREYARYLGLNSDEMVNRYNAAAAADDRIEKPPSIARYPDTPVKDIAPRPPRKRGIPPVWARVDGNVIALLFLAAALAGVAWFAVRYRNNERAEAADAAVARAEAPKAAVPKAAPAPSSAAPPADDSRLRLAVEVTANSWVTLEADGETLINAEMTAGEQRAFEAEREFRFRTIGNAGGLTLQLNGMVVPQLGAEGEVVRDRVFDRRALERLRNPAAGAAEEPESADPAGAPPLEP